MKVRAGKWLIIYLSAMIRGDTSDVDKVKLVFFKSKKERKEVIDYSKYVGMMLQNSWGLEIKPMAKVKQKNTKKVDKANGKKKTTVGSKKNSKSNKKPSLKKTDKTANGKGSGKSVAKSKKNPEKNGGVPSITEVTRTKISLTKEKIQEEKRSYEEQNEKKRDKKKATAEVEKNVKTDDLSPLKKAIEEAASAWESAKAEVVTSKKVADNAKNTHRDALILYRNACKKAGLDCEFSSSRLANVSDRVSFSVEKVEEGIKVMIKGRPETEELIPASELNQSLNKAAYAFAEKHLGSRDEIGNKGGTLSNRLRKVWM